MFFLLIINLQLGSLLKEFIWLTKFDTFHPQKLTTLKCYIFLHICTSQNEMESLVRTEGGNLKNNKLLHCREVYAIPRRMPVHFRHKGPRNNYRVSMCQFHQDASSQLLRLQIPKSQKDCQVISRKKSWPSCCTSADLDFMLSAQVWWNWPQVLISPTFYRHPFSFESVFRTFSMLTIKVCNFLTKGNWRQSCLYKVGKNDPISIQLDSFQKDMLS